MVLTLSGAPPAVRERSVVPACLQPRAPMSYEIRDEHDRRVPPTLAGYKLRRGKSYRLKVRTQDGSARNWKLRLLALRSVLEPPDSDEVDGDARCVNFHVTTPPLSEWWGWFRSQVIQAPVKLDFEDGREPYKFHLPIVLLSSRLRRIGFFLLSAAAPYLVDAVYHDHFSVPSPTTLLICGGIGVLTLIGCFFWDQWKFYRRAVRLTGRNEERHATNGTGLVKKDAS